MKLINYIKNNMDEFLCSLYFWMFSFTRYFLAIYSLYSFYILLFVSSAIILLSVFFSKKTTVLNVNALIIFFIVFLVLIVSYLLTPNVVVFERAYEFIIYGVLSIYLFSKVRDYKIFFKFFSYMSVLSFLLYCFDPFNNYIVFGDYMSFGFNCILLVFCGCSIGFKLFNKKIFFIVKYLSLIELALFCNKGAFVAGLFLELLFLILKKEKPFYKFIKIILLLFAMLLFYFYFNNLLLVFTNLLNHFHINSYSLSSITKFLYGESNGFAGRDLIWKNAFSFISERPIFGHGIGAFESTYGIYTHNIFLDILCSHGISGLIVFIIMNFIYFYKLKKVNNNERYIYMFFFAIGVVPLLFSIYTFKWHFFWIYLYLIFAKRIVVDNKMN